MVPFLTGFPISNGIFQSERVAQASRFKPAANKFCAIPFRNAYFAVIERQKLLYFWLFDNNFV
jgi:hypothetical protein